MLGELPRRCLDERSDEAFGKPHPVTLQIGAGVLPKLKRFGIVTEIDADLLEHRFAIALDKFEAFLAQDFINRNVPLDIGKLFRGSA
jgi:hypothetical protein